MVLGKSEAIKRRFSQPLFQAFDELGQLFSVPFAGRAPKGLLKRWYFSEAAAFEGQSEHRLAQLDALERRLGGGEQALGFGAG